MGFRHIGTETEFGRKFGRFWDVALYERAMAA
jgi:phosphinothricin acetyltransferase